ncbi:DNA replication/repair protein RecF [Lysobacter sp. GX 14042]|uniref:DNA replication/repair protein RecF n=1 Tax=Lysobacter sp. GX 14042 TaxID=2907155 RepID=UPI001F48E733|nr:DNA replication/repair protein RecF [Lysobacter sp. GX 14042]MCE7032348.1 DNA replication/repair protein RecF [Lysobacter sp. GX 14042]
MRVTRLDIRNLRRFGEVSLAPGPGLNVLVGDNGAGKTSVLEALHLLGYGRSFRGRVREGLVREGHEALEVFAQWTSAPDPRGDAPTARQAGLRHSGHAWTGRLDGSQVDKLGDICAAFAVVTFEPGSHALVAGGADNRRRYLDWGLFHVERDFMVPWRRYSRALKQRNALLKRRAGDAELAPWEAELAGAGERLGAMRSDYLQALEPRMAALARELAPALGEVALQYQPGWKETDSGLADALLLARERDRQAGFTSVGPHRADWKIGFSGIPGRDALSRGQAKLTALSALLAQAGHHAEVTGEWPVVALDDLPSELDRTHQARVLDYLAGSGAQVFVTGTGVPAGAPGTTGCIRFHVEHGQLGPGVPC